MENIEKLEKPVSQQNILKKIANSNKIVEKECLMKVKKTTISQLNCIFKVTSMIINVIKKVILESFSLTLSLPVNEREIR